MTRKYAPGGARGSVSIKPSGEGWTVWRGERAGTSIHETQSEAIAAATRDMRRSGGMVQVYGRNGRVKDIVSIGLEGASKIAAVEQIDLRHAMGDAFPAGDVSVKDHLAALASRLSGRKS